MPVNACICCVQTVCAGSWITKFTNDGKGPLHPRFFHVNPSNLRVQSSHVAFELLIVIISSLCTSYFLCCVLQVCWSKIKDASSKDVKSGKIRSFSTWRYFNIKDESHCTSIQTSWLACAPQPAQQCLEERTLTLSTSTSSPSLSSPHHGIQPLQITLPLYKVLDTCMGLLRPQGPGCGCPVF